MSDPPADRDDGVGEEAAENPDAVTNGDPPDDGDPPPQSDRGLDESTARAVLEDALGEGSWVAAATAVAAERDEPESAGSEGAESERDGADEEEVSEAEPEPEELLSQPLTEEREVSPDVQPKLRETYGYVRAFFKSRPERYRRLQRSLKQARVRDTYDEYLTDSARLAVLTAVVGGVVGNALVAWLALTDGVEALEPLFVVFGTSHEAFLASPLLAAALLVPALGSVAAGVGVWTVRNYYLPRSVVAARRRGIDGNLPYAITFMYALSSGGMNFVEVCRRVADADEVYGEVAAEFDVIVREIDLFGNDLPQAFGNARDLTPSETFRQFLDDVLGVLESGGDLEAFLEEESEEALDDALEEQESFVETLGVLSELFVVGFVAAPLFVIVVLVVVSFLGDETVGTIGALVYVGFPLAMVGFLLLVDLLARPYEDPDPTVTVEDERSEPPERVREDPRFEAYERHRRQTGLRAVLADPFQSIRRRPVLSLAVTVPAAVVVAGVAVWSGLATPTRAAFLAAPLATTGWLAVAPLVVATAPLTVLHERHRRRNRRVTERFPEVLSIMASANRMGVDLVDAFDLVTRWAGGRLAVELGKVRNDVAWNHDLRRALLGLAQRLDAPQLTRTMALIAEGSRSSGDLHGLLEIAAKDTRARARLARARRRAVGSYVTIVVIGFLVYLLVIVMLGASYLEPIAETAAETEAADVPSGPVSLGSIPVDAFEVLFLHSALIQGFGAGLLAGKLAENTVLAGLKYGLGLVGLTVAAFFLFV